MATIVVDEDMYRSVAEPLTQLGHRVLDVRDCGLRGAKDPEVFAFAQRRQAALLTGDLGFGNLLAFPLGTHHGSSLRASPTRSRPRPSTPRSWSG